MPDLKSELLKVAPIVLTPEVFEEICQTVCPHCQRNSPVRQRNDTKEWVHDNKKQVGHMVVSVDHVLCWANGFRNSRFAEVLK